MARQALTFEGRVVGGAVNAANRFPVVPEMVWVPCGDDVRLGWLYSDGNFSAPPIAPPKTDQERAEEEILKNRALKAIVFGLAEMRSETPAQTKQWLKGFL